MFCYFSFLELDVCGSLPLWDDVNFTRKEQDMTTYWEPAESCKMPNYVIVNTPPKYKCTPGTGWVPQPEKLHFCVPESKETNKK